LEIKLTKQSKRFNLIMASRSSRLSDLQGMSNGVSLVLKSLCAQQTGCLNLNARVLSMNDLDYFKLSVENKLGDMVTKSPQEQIKTAANKASTFVRQARTILQSNVLNRTGFYTSSRQFYSMTKYNLYQYQARGLSTSTLNPAAEPTQDANAKKSSPNVPKFKQKVGFFFSWTELKLSVRLTTPKYSS
jgi:hypothetical protein